MDQNIATNGTPTHDILPGMLALGRGVNPFSSTADSYKPRVLDFDYTGDTEPYQDSRAAGIYKAQNETLARILSPDRPHVMLRATADDRRGGRSIWQ